MNSEIYDNNGQFFLDNDSIAQLLSLPSNQERYRLFVELHATHHAYELWDFLSHKVQSYCHVKDYDKLDTALDFDIKNAVLDIVIANANKTNIDETVCFLLEAYIDGRIEFTDLFCLTDVDHNNLTNALDFMWELHENGMNYILPDMISKYKWNDYVAININKVLNNYDDNSIDSSDFYNFATEYEKYHDLPDYWELANIYKTYKIGLSHYHRGEYFDAIESLHLFHNRWPRVKTNIVVTTLCRSYIAVGWRYFAEMLVLRYIDDPSMNTAELKEIHRETYSDHKAQIEIIRKSIIKDHWCEDCCDIMSETEMMYRYYGELMRDCAVLISGYARAVESQLREIVFPILEKLVVRYGLEDKHGHYIPITKFDNNQQTRDKIRMNNKLTLGGWKYLFKQHNYLEQFSTKGTVYNLYYSHKYRYISKPQQFMQTFGAQIYNLGENIEQLCCVRNPSAHEVVREWNFVEEARDVSNRILNDYVFLIKAYNGL